MTAAVDFVLPAGLEASEPPERRGLARDEVRLLVASAQDSAHARFRDLPDHLRPGDLVVVNTSATLPAALPGDRAGLGPVTVHVATALDDGTWVVELRPPVNARGPVRDARGGQVVRLPAGVTLRLLAPYSPHLWRARPELEGTLPDYLGRYGHPVTYGYVPGRHPLSDYQTVFASEPGSAEMASAGRPFTHELVTRLVVRGVAVAPVTLHTGLSSAQDGEPPPPERFAVPAPTAALVNATRSAGGRVVAVGTTVTRALESAAGPDRVVRAAQGWTGLALGPDRPARIVDGLVTGWHAPGASHLLLLQAVAGPALVARAYDEALAHGYLWHEFGDSALLLP
ncbi:MAG: Queuosine biosynthesis protein [Frankiales bacterium]|nr:Queuosine biosynthesis protein [Frankiales bacterium]